MTSAEDSRAYVLRLGLGPIPASSHEVLAEFGDRIEHYQPVIAETPTGLELSLTVAATDLWLAVLQAMSATVGAGYPIHQLEAHRVTRPTRRPPPMAPEQD